MSLIPRRKLKDAGSSSFLNFEETKPAVYEKYGTKFILKGKQHTCFIHKALMLSARCQVPH